MHHSPKKNNGLSVSSLLALQPKRFSGIWLDLKYAQEPTREFLLEYPNRIRPTKQRRQGEVSEVSSDRYNQQCCNAEPA